MQFCYAIRVDLLAYSASEELAASRATLGGLSGKLKLTICCRLPTMKPLELQQVRERLRLTQAQFGQLLGVHPMTVSKWERGVAQPTPYQQALIQQFTVASARKEVQRSDLSSLLIGAGIIAVLALLLSESNKK
jgi:putative transcriptional regulator